MNHRPDHAAVVTHMNAAPWWTLASEDQWYLLDVGEADIERCSGCRDVVRAYARARSEGAKVVRSLPNEVRFSSGRCMCCWRLLMDVSGQRCRAAATGAHTVEGVRIECSGPGMSVLSHLMDALPVQKVLNLDSEQPIDLVQCDDSPPRVRWTMLDVQMRSPRGRRP